MHRAAYNYAFNYKSMLACAFGASSVAFGLNFPNYRYTFAENDKIRYYTVEDVAKHKTEEEGIWVIHEGGVYDITTFVEQHPGGSDKIMMAAGGSVDRYWKLYKQHKQPFVLELIEKYRIGSLDPDQAAQMAAEASVDPYANEPQRHPDLTLRVAEPFNSETPTTLIPGNYITSNELFFVRNHLPVPLIKEDEYRLYISLDGKPETEKVLTLEDIKKFEKVTITSVIQCGGNRRSEMNGVQKVKGTSWTQGAISNARWSGARLKDVLDELGFDYNDERIQHLHFEGYDDDMAGKVYGASIPIQKGISLEGDVILAYEMNGVTLPRDHGHPIRVLVPGTVGARSVKWLKSITLSEVESSSHWQRRDYKSFNPSTNWDNVDFDKAVSIQETPVQSAICVPSTGDSVALGKPLTIQGYSYSGGGRSIIRVDISTDQGKTWSEAKLLPTDGLRHRSKDWGWTLWEAEIDIPKEIRDQKLEIICKAVDSSYNEQPSMFSHIWNLRGLVSNAWHRVEVDCEEDDDEDDEEFVDVE